MGSFRTAHDLDFTFYGWTFGEQYRFKLDVEPKICSIAEACFW